MSTRLLTLDRGVLWGVELAQPPPRVTPRLDATCALVGPESAPALAEAMGVEQGLVRQRLASGRRCFVYKYQGTVVTYGWVSQGAEYIGEQEREIRLEADEAYIWDCATLPAFRGQHLYSGLLSCMLYTLGAEGVRRVWIGTSVTNRASVRGIVHAGFHPVVTLSYARLLSLRLQWIGEYRGAPKGMIAAARRALLCPDERIFGPLVIAWAPSAAIARCAEMKA